MSKVLKNNIQNTWKKKEFSFLKRLNTPAKIQDFLEKIPFNFEKNGIDTIKSPIRTFRENNAHCFEGALLGAYILSLHGFPSLLLHLKVTGGDMDHVIAPFKINGYWGALSKTNHAVLRYREPVYKNIRELVMSYFHEYFLDNGQKTLRQYSKVLNLNIFEKDWVTDSEDLWGIDEELDNIAHYDVLPKNLVSKKVSKKISLRKADRVEILASRIEQYKK
ncbi:MAG: hypothetical protein K9L98_01900 [Candidatus Pacebacteria bacterium]|nr:hypothetical protein [Candidatus Paceibacterota bacterium]MCF7862741.1 hypothetical protein [Candidatus Paceibacterota bacterium]